MDGMDGRKLPTENRCACAMSMPQIDVAATTAKAGSANRDAAPARLQRDNKQPVIMTLPL